MNHNQPTTYLVVNADDYGYFDCVSRGIIDSFTNGVLSATGIMANGVNFDEQVSKLFENKDLDLGLHLSLTDGKPLTSQMQDRLSAMSGNFPKKFALVKALLKGTIRPNDVLAEWDAQINRCLEKGLTIRFLNSHEHIHMWPSLFPVIQTLASRYDIAHIRFPTSQPFSSLTPHALIRDIPIKIFEFFNRRHLQRPVLPLCGMEYSGKLTKNSLLKTVRSLQKGRIYELMCHPGYLDSLEITDPAILKYHHWEEELGTLTDPETLEILEKHGVRVIGYRHISSDSGQFSVNNENV